MKSMSASLPAGEVLAAEPASALSVLSASASLSLKHRLQNNTNMNNIVPTFQVPILRQQLFSLEKQSILTTNINKDKPHLLGGGEGVLG